MLTWNTNAVNAVRASSPAKFQVEGLIYMSYVQAAVYDAATKIAGRYKPYHDSRSRRFPAPRCRRRSLQLHARFSTTTCLTSKLPLTPEYTSLYRDAYRECRGRGRGRPSCGERPHCVARR